MKKKNKVVKYNSSVSMITNLSMWLGLRIKFKRFDEEIHTIERIYPNDNYPVVMSSGERYSYKGFFKNYTNIDGSSLED